MSKWSPEFTPQEQRVITAVDKGDILGANLASVNQIRLTHAQNVQLGEAIQEGLKTSKRIDPETKSKIDELALGNAGLAAKLTLDLASKVPSLTEPDLADCLQNGIISLLAAAEIYDPWYKAEPTSSPSHASRFSTIAVPHIQGGLNRSASEFQSIRLPNEMANRARQYRHNYELRQQLGLSLNHQDISESIAKRAGLKASSAELPAIAKNIQLALNSTNVVSLEDPRLVTIETEYTGESIQIEIERGDLLSDRTQDPEGTLINQRELKDQVQEALEVLTDREREVIKMRFGLEDGLSHTIEEIGHHFLLNEDRVRQIEDKALGKLRSPNKSYLLRDFL